MTASEYSAPRDAVYAAPQANAPLHRVMQIPGSKSLTARELVLSALARSPSTLHRPLHSDDTQRMVDALTALGADITPTPGDGAFGPDWQVTPAEPIRPGTVDAGQSGTVMRFVTPMAGLAAGDSLVTAAANARHRPMGQSIGALRALGVDVADEGRGTLPFTVHGRGHIRGGEASIDASASSQFVSGLLLAAARFDVGLHLRHAGARLPSVPHIEMTIDTLKRRGVSVQRPSDTEWVVAPGTIRGADVDIEPDLSNAAPFFAAAIVTDGAVGISGWPAKSTQPGAQLADLFASFGARTRRRDDVLTVGAGPSIRGVELDLSSVSELTPTLVGLAAFADAPSTFTGIGHIRGHETDRIRALAENLAAVGIRADELDDGIRVHPGTPSAGLWRAHHDHRIATTGALIGLRTPGLVIDDITVTAKTLPQFPELWSSLVAARV